MLAQDKSNFISSPAEEQTVIVKASTVNAKSPLAITIRSDKKLCKVEESFEINVLLRNVSALPLYLYDEPDWRLSGSLTPSLRDLDSGRYAESRFITDAPPPPQSKRDFFRLASGETRQVKVACALAEFNLKVGRQYELTIIYRSPIGSQETFGLRTIRQDFGDIVSNPIMLKIVE